MRKRCLRRAAALSWFLTLGVTAVLGAERADHWTEFRGGAGDGKAPDAKLPITWGEEHHVRWKIPVEGKAWSSPVVWQDQVWLTNATEDGKTLSAVGVDAATGEVLHDVIVFEIAEPMYCHPYNSYGSPTPVIEGDRLWVHYGSAGTACINTQSGEVLWRRQDLPCDHYRGPGSSPILFEDLLIMNFDGYDFQYVIALDKHTGDTVWKTDRTIDYGTTNGDAKKAYCTPTVIEHDGRVQLISPAAVATVSYDPRTGKELWIVYHGGFNAAARPVYDQGLVILNLEGGKRMVAVRPDGEGNVTGSHIEWINGKATPTRPSQLLVDGHLYMVSDKGIVSCLDLSSGEVRWTHRIGGRYSASPLYADGRIYLFDEDGKGQVLRANPEQFELLAENSLEKGCMASPAVVGDALLVRTKTHLYRIENPGTP